MSDISTTSCLKDNSCDNSISPIMLLVLLSMCGGNNNMFGCFGQGNSCGCNNGMEGMLPILLLLFLGGGSLF